MATLPRSMPPMAGPVLWRGEPVRAKVLRRHLGRAIEAVVYQAGGIASIVLTVQYAGGAVVPPIIVLVFVLVGICSLVAGLIAAQRAIAAARHRRYAITEEMLVTESPDRRHERRLSNLPELVFDGEGGGVATISCAETTPAVWRWLRPFVPVRLETEVLLESVPDAGRALALLRAGSGAGSRATAEPGAVAARPQEPVEVPRVARPAWEKVTSIPWTMGILLTAFCLFFLSRILPGPWRLETLVAVVFVVAMLGLGLASIGAQLWRWRVHAAIRRDGVRVMAEVRGLAKANVRVNDAEMWVVQYAYPANGATYVADSGLLPRDDAERWSAGDRVLVAYDQANPSISIWLGGGQGEYE